MIMYCYDDDVVVLLYDYVVVLCCVVTIDNNDKDNKYNIMAYILSDQNDIPVRVSVFSGIDKSAPLFSALSLRCCRRCTAPWTKSRSLKRNSAS